MTPPKELDGLINFYENRKAYSCQNPKIKSKIIATSSVGPPTYFVRADYETGPEAKKTPISYWQINNHFAPYLQTLISNIETLKDLIKMEKAKDINAYSSKEELKRLKARLEFHTTIRQISEREIKDRISEDRIIMIKKK